MDFSNMKLGLLPGDPTLPALKVSDFLTGIVPEVPNSVDYMSGIQFGLYENDRWGICGPTSVCNSRRGLTSKLLGKMIAPTQQDCYDLYRRSGNPRFNPNLDPDDPRQDDNGVIMQKMLQALHIGGVGGKRCMAYARVDAKDFKELHICTAVFGCVLFGVDLHKAQQSQTDKGYWDYVPGSGSWGGHAISSHKSDDTIDVITWGKPVQMTKNFIAKQSSEAWVVIWAEHFGNEQFMKSVDFKALKSAYESLTGKRLPEWGLKDGNFILVG